MTEFNLSEKIIGKRKVKLGELEILDVVDVKEFIRLLKEEAKGKLNPDDAYWFIQFIEKRAGEKLIK